MTSIKAQSNSAIDNHADKNIVTKSKKSQTRKILIRQQFLSDVLNQSKMKSIREYLKQNQNKQEEKIYFSQQSYSIYEDYLLLNTLKECQDKIYANNMHFQLTQIKIKNSQRTLKSYSCRIYLLMDDLEKIKNKYSKRKQKSKFEIKENIIKHLNLLIDAKILQILQKYVDQHKEQLKNSTQSVSQYINKPFTLLEDCIILKTFKQMINQNSSYKPIMKCLSEKLKRQKSSIFSRLYYLLNSTKQKLVLCIQNNLTIKIKPKKQINSWRIIQNMKITVNQLILIQLKQQLDTKNEHNSYNLNVQTIQHLMILMYIKKYVGQLSLQQIFQIISQKLDFSKRTICNKFYLNILPKLKKSLSGSSKIQKCFQQIQAKVQHLQAQQRTTLKVKSKSNTFKNSGKMLDISQQNISEVDTFINKLHESRFKEDNGQIIDILKEIQFSVKKQNELFMSSNVHQSLFFQNQQWKQDNKTCSSNNYQSFCIEQKSSKKQRKNQKKKRKQKMTVVEEHNLTLTESLTFQNNLQYIRQKWHLNPQVDEETVYDESDEVKEQDK